MPPASSIWLFVRGHRVAGLTVAVHSRVTCRGRTWVGQGHPRLAMAGLRPGRSEPSRCCPPSCLARSPATACRRCSSTAALSCSHIGVMSAPYDSAPLSAGPDATAIDARTAAQAHGRACRRFAIYGTLAARAVPVEDMCVLSVAPARVSLRSRRPRSAKARSNRAPTYFLRSFLSVAQEAYLREKHGFLETHIKGHSE
jgi:hypothetical protein